MDLFSDIRFIKGVGEERAKLFRTLGVETVFDMLCFFPRDYEDRSVTKNIIDCRIGESVCIKAFADCAPREHRIRKGFFLYKFTVSDGTGVVEITLFNQKFAAQNVKEDNEYIFFGKIERGRYGLIMNSPEIEPVEKAGKMTSAIVPKYNLTANLSRKVCLTVIKNCLDAVGNIPDIFTADFRKKYNICEINYALKNIHFPEDERSMLTARRRLAFEELYLLSLGIMRMKQRREDFSGSAFSHTDLSGFVKNLPFPLTGAQKRVLGEISADVRTTKVMNRLVQGDVGSGKTAVAAACALMAKNSGFQTALMAPTEILARQHAETFEKLLPGVQCVLLTGKMTKKQKALVLERIKEGTADVVVGTHALLEENVEFKSLGLVITDEQHRFGVSQRARLTAKGKSPHVLIMTATPIPRTLALTLYGDLDVSVIDELPPGRQEIKTYAVGENMRERIYAFLKKQLDEGRQAYIICPLVDPSDKIEAAAAAEFMEQLRENELCDYKIGLMHGKIKDKDSVMEAFAKGEIDALISTTVVEVGVNVPNATVIIIENAERFGLSQLHQLRGRVGRGADQSYCILVTNYKLTEETRKRLEIMVQTNDGFEIAEADLKLRGPGDLEGTQQSGMAFDLKIADLARDGQLLQYVREVAQQIVDTDPNAALPENELLWKRLKALRKTNVNWAAIS